MYLIVAPHLMVALLLVTQKSDPRLLISNMTNVLKIGGALAAGIVIAAVVYTWNASDEPSIEVKESITETAPSDTTSETATSAEVTPPEDNQTDTTQAAADATEEETPFSVVDQEEPQAEVETTMDVTASAEPDATTSIDDNSAKGAKRSWQFRWTASAEFPRWPK